MEKKLFLSILGMSLVVLVVALLIPGGKSPDVKPLLPWNITIEPSGASKVFDLTLGRSTMEDARHTFHSEGKMNLFASQENAISIEAFFDRIAISGLKADVILNLSMDPKILSEMYSRGARMNQLGSGEKKVTMSTTDMATAANAVIQQITYVPATNLDGDLIMNLFGKPDSIVKEDSGVEHWLYPKTGLSIVLNPDGKEVLQYVNPDRFDQVIKPLQEMKKPKK